MDTTTQGLMGPDDTIIDDFRNAILGSQRPKTLTQLLRDLSAEDAAQVQRSRTTSLSRILDYKTKSQLGT